MFTARWPLKRRLALWVLDQALPEAPDLTAVLRTVFATMAAGSAVGVALIGLVVVGLMGLHQLMLEQGLSNSAATLGITGIALLMVFAAYRFIKGMIDSWGRERASMRLDTDILTEAKDLVTTLALDLFDGLKEEPAPKKRKTTEEASIEVEEDEDSPVIYLKTTKK